MNDESKILEQLDLLSKKLQENKKLLKISYRPLSPVRPTKPYLRELKKPQYFRPSQLLKNFLFGFLPVIYINYLFFGYTYYEKMALYGIVFSVIIEIYYLRKSITIYNELKNQETIKLREFDLRNQKYESLKVEYERKLDEHYKAEAHNKPILESGKSIQIKMDTLIEEMLNISDKSNRLKLRMSLLKYMAKDRDCSLIKPKPFNQKNTLTINAENTIFCPKCGGKFNFNYSSVNEVTGGIGGIAAGALLGGKVGIALGPLGAIAGTIPGAVLGGIIGKNSGKKIGNPMCPHCGTKFSVAR